MHLTKVSRANTLRTKMALKQSIKCHMSMLLVKLSRANLRFIAIRKTPSSKKLEAKVAITTVVVMANAVVKEARGTTTATKLLFRPSNLEITKRESSMRRSELLVSSPSSSTEIVLQRKSYRSNLHQL